MDIISQDEVIQILRIVEESTFDELCLEMGDFKLILKKHGGSEINQRPSQSGEIFAHPEVGQERQSVPMDVKQRKPEKVASAPEKDGREIEAIGGNQEEGYIPIRSPMLGTFYRAPKPGAPPFVEVGRWVSADDSVCIIEVMKLFNTVKSNIRGRIAKVCAENGQMVEYQQTLFLVEEVDGAGATDKEEIAS
ncbi:MAG: biotin/lipoyl-containing protein [Candidatus Desulfacyla sp.]